MGEAGAGEVAALVERLLLAKAPMLAEYLSLGAPARRARPGLGRACIEGRPPSLRARHPTWRSGAAAPPMGDRGGRGSRRAGAKS